MIMASQITMAQQATFETLSIPSESALYGQDQVTDGDTVYTDNIWSFETNYNAAWMSYGGFAFSNVTDNTTPGWGNQYAAITGAGEGPSDNYAICYIDGWNSHRVFHSAASPTVISGAYFTNTTYAYYSMLDGDMFAKKFGEDTSATGVIDGSNGEDWLLLTIYGLGADSSRTGDSVNFYLADYRFADGADDYIIDDWTWVDLSSLGNVKGLDFELNSTDTTGGWGMNTPSYFAMDNLALEFLSVDENEPHVNVYPNPSSGIVVVSSPMNGVVSLQSIDGKIIDHFTKEEVNLTLDFSELPTGTYILTLVSATSQNIERIVIR